MHKGINQTLEELFAQVDFREVCQNLYDGIHIADGEGRVLFINAAYTRTTGITPEEILGRKVAEIEAEGKLYKGSVTSRVIATKARADSVATIHKMKKDVLVTGIPVFDAAGNVKMVVTNTRDFPELKHLEQELLALTEEQRKTKEELVFLRRQQAGGQPLIYRSAAMQSVMELIQTVAKTDVTVLITGESGTGKELVANELYQNSSRRDKPFIKVNCAAIPSDLLESELFGYEEGAFTGARREGRTGMFELANTGMLLLDEIGDMPLALQTKLLRVLQQRELMRIGGTRAVKLDVRLIASTNKDLREEVRQGRFREDLYYRLNVIPIELKPLRERKADISFLATEFFSKFCKKYGKTMRLSPGGMELLLEYPWPGNIRELENLVERIVVTNTGETTVSHSHIFTALNLGKVPLQPHGTETHTLKEQVAVYEREIILRSIEKAGSIRRAAKALGVDHSTLVKKCKQYEMLPDSKNGEFYHQYGE